MVAKCELIEPNPGDKRYIRRDDEGRFTKYQVSVGRSLAADNNQKANTVIQPDQGDRGDRKSRNWKV